jgi:hypothetical protein
LATGGLAWSFGGSDLGTKSLAGSDICFRPDNRANDPLSLTIPAPSYVVISPGQWSTEFDLEAWSPRKGEPGLEPTTCPCNDRADEGQLIG